MQAGTERNSGRHLTERYSNSKDKHRADPRAVMDREKPVTKGSLAPRLAQLLLFSSDAYKKAAPGFRVPRAAAHGSTNQAPPASKGETSGETLLPRSRPAHGLVKVNRLGVTCAAAKVFTPSRSRNRTRAATATKAEYSSVSPAAMASDRKSVV